MSKLYFEGKPALDMINQKPFFDTEIFYKTDLEEQENGVFVKGCMAINVDPEIVTKQARLILRLQNALDTKLNDELNLCAPSFKQYAELEKENEELKSKLKRIQELIE